MLWSMECSICGVKIKSDGPADIGAGKIDVDANGIDGIGVGAEEGGTTDDAILPRKGIG